MADDPERIDPERVREEMADADDGDGPDLVEESEAGERPDLGRFREARRRLEG
jgi:hypothetical protein